jgi:hypothetical protein
MEPTPENLNAEEMVDQYKAALQRELVSENTKSVTEMPPPQRVHPPRVGPGVMLGYDLLPVEMQVQMLYQMQQRSPQRLTPSMFGPQTPPKPSAAALEQRPAKREKVRKAKAKRQAKAASRKRNRAR